MTGKVGPARLYQRLRDLEALWKGTKNVHEKAATLLAMQKLEKNIRAAGDSFFSLDAYLGGVESKASNPEARVEEGLYEVAIGRTAGWAARLIELLAEQRAGAVAITRSRRGRESIYELRGEAAKELFDHFEFYRDALFATEAFNRGGHRALNDGFEIMEVVRREMVG